jgi:putative membrane protein
MMGFGMMGGMLLFWILLIILVVWAVRGLFQSNQHPPVSQTPTAKQILEQRYARGEINRDQYLLMLKEIE